jgi:prepilin-type N-terminal cleavage/methylation domain-containing protein
MKKLELLEKKGFTLIELLMIITLIGILSGITYSIAVPRWRERTYYTRSVAEMSSIANGMKLYVAKYNDFPPDASRNLPSGIQEFVQGQEAKDDWPAAPFPGSVYDWDNWPPDGNGPLQTYQISIRFCGIGDDAGCKKMAKKYLAGRTSDAILNSWDSYSAMYYCVKGSCRSHQSKPINHPGFCINCGSSQSQIY